MAITDDLCRSFLDLWWHFDPAAATRAGNSEQDGRLGSFDPESIRQHVAALRSIAGAVEELDVAETADEIDRTALLDHLRVLLFRFEHEHPYRRNPALWVEHVSDGFGGILAREAADARPASAALDRLGAVPRFFTEARESLRRPPLFLVDTALAQLDGLSTLLAELSRRFAGAWAGTGDFGPRVVADAEAAVERFGLALRAQIVADSEPGSALIGEEEVDRRLHFEHASIHNGAEVWRASLRLATEVEQEVVAASIDPGRPWRDVYAGTREHGGRASDSQSSWRGALEKARRFAESGGLLAGVTAPLDVVPASPVARLTEPIACYRPGAGGIGAAIEIGDADPAAIPWLAAALGFPGLHVHRARCEALPGLVRRHIAASSTPFGWSVYAEELMAGLGYAPDPESRLAERVLFLRDAHLAVADIGLHTGQFTPVDAVGRLATRLPLEQAAALADVRRLAAHPLSACAAILGRGEIRRLRDDLRASRGARFDAASFHEELFGYGGIPVPLIRWEMGLDG